MMNKSFAPLAPLRVQFKNYVCTQTYRAHPSFMYFHLRIRTRGRLQP